jgi:hypothetical protein
MLRHNAMEFCLLAAEKMQSMLHVEGTLGCYSSDNRRIGGDAPEPHFVRMRLDEHISDLAILQRLRHHRGANNDKVIVVPVLPFNSELLYRTCEHPTTKYPWQFERHATRQLE